MSLYIVHHRECVTSRMNFNAAYGLWVMKMCRVGSSIVMNVPLWCGILVVGEVVHLGVRAREWTSSVC